MKQLHHHCFDKTPRNSLLSFFAVILVLTVSNPTVAVTEPPKVWPEKPTGSAVEVVYPRDKNQNGKFPLRAGIDSTFLLGNVANPQQTKLSINDHPVKIESTGGWLIWLKCPSRHEDFTWKIVAVTGTDSVRIELPVERTKVSQQLDVEKFPKPFWVITKPGARFRNKPQGKNIMLPIAGTPVKVVSRVENSYGAKLSDGTMLWMDTAKVQKIKKLPIEKPVSDFLVSYDSTHRKTTVLLRNGSPKPFFVDLLTSDKFIFRFERIQFSDQLVAEIDPKSIVTDVSTKPTKKGTQLELSLKKDSFLLGYDLRSTPNGLEIILKEAPTNETKVNQPLSNWKVVVDPGHGGIEYGAIGPTWLSEKTVNLRVATELTSILRDFGATVIQTRVTDTTVSLLDRVGLAENENADLLISVHQNALPDDENPWDGTGSAVYYFHPQSKGLAEELHKQLLERLALPKREVYVGDFAICRSQQQLSVLTEATYIIRPDQEQMLHDPAFIRKQASAIADGILNYLSKRSNRN